MTDTRRMLVAVAHPDDCELTCGGTVRRWVIEGGEAVLLLATNGARGGKFVDADADIVGDTRRREQHEAADVLGFSEVVQLDFTDGELQNAEDVRRQLVRHIRRVKPHVAVFMDPTTVIYRDYYVNHTDHRALGMAMLDAMYPSASNAGYFPEQIGEGLEPYKVPETLLAQSDQPNYWVDVSDTLDVRFEALRCHRSQMRLWPDNGEAVIEQQRAVALALGLQHGARYAEEFRRVVVNPLA